MSAFIMALVLATQSAVPPAVSDARPPISDARRERIATLSQLAAKRDYLALRKLLDSASSPEEFMDSLDWERDQFVAGGSALVDILYARDLARLADSVPDKDDLLGTAGMASLAALVMIQSDGTHCADQSAVGHRVDQLMTIDPRIWPHLKAMPEAKRRQIATIVVAYEARVSASRPADGDAPFVCRGGLSEMSEGLAAGLVTPVPTPPGGVGKTFAVGDAQSVPRTVEPSVWKPKLEKVRAELPKLIAGLLDLKD